VFLDQNARKNLSEEVKNCQNFEFDNSVDLLVVVGGDGTVLRATRYMKDLNVPLLGINVGRLGFLAEIKTEHFDNTCQLIWEGQFTKDPRMLLKVELVRDGEVVLTHRALNEFTIGLSEVSRIIELDISVDSYPVSHVLADGFIVATPTGSTAHSLSAGGPILHPKMEAFILTPIAPHSFTQKPIVITPEKVIEIKPKGRNRENIMITMDGQVSEKIEKGDVIRISKHEEKVCFLRLLDESFFKTIKAKLFWGEGFNTNGE
jgi:NAD+ kinase